MKEYKKEEENKNRNKIDRYWFSFGVFLWIVAKYPQQKSKYDSFIFITN